MDIGASCEGLEEGGDLGGVVFGDGVEGVGVAVGFEEAADELAGFVFFDGAGVGAGDNGAGDGALAGLLFVVLVAHDGNSKRETRNTKRLFAGGGGVGGGGFGRGGPEWPSISIGG